MNKKALILSIVCLLTGCGDGEGDGSGGTTVVVSNTNNQNVNPNPTADPGECEEACASVECFGGEYGYQIGCGTAIVDSDIVGSADELPFLCLQREIPDCEGSLSKQPASESLPSGD